MKAINIIKNSPVTLLLGVSLFTLFSHSVVAHGVYESDHDRELVRLNTGRDFQKVKTTFNIGKARVTYKSGIQKINVPCSVKVTNVEGFEIGDLVDVEMSVKGLGTTKVTDLSFKGFGGKQRTNGIYFEKENPRHSLRFTNNSLKRTRVEAFSTSAPFDGVKSIFCLKSLLPLQLR